MTGKTNPNPDQAYPEPDPDRMCARCKRIKECPLVNSFAEAIFTWYPPQAMSVVAGQPFEEAFGQEIALKILICFGTIGNLCPLFEEAESQGQADTFFHAPGPADVC